MQFFHYVADGEGTQKTYAELFEYVDQYLATAPPDLVLDYDDIPPRKLMLDLQELLIKDFPGILEFHDGLYYFHLKDEVITNDVLSDDLVDEKQFYEFGYGNLVYIMISVVLKNRMLTPLSARPVKTPAQYKKI